MPMLGSYAERHGRGQDGSRHRVPGTQEAAGDSPSKRRHLREVSATAGDQSLRGSPARRSCSGDSGHGRRRRQPEELTPATHEQRRLQRELARRQLGLLPPEQRYMPASSRKGTDEAARRALVAHLQEVDQAMKRIKDGTRSSRPRTHVQRLKARQTSSMPVSPMRREPVPDTDAAPPPYAPQLVKHGATKQQQSSYEVHASTSSRAPAGIVVPHSQAGLPKPGRRSSGSFANGTARSAYSAPVSPSKGARLTRHASAGLPTIKESHVSLATLLSAPAQLSPDRADSHCRSAPRPPRGSLAAPVTSDAERRRRSEACLDARLQAHPAAQLRAGSGAARALWPDAPAAGPAYRDSSADRGEPSAAQPVATAADEPTPPRAVPAEAVWAQPPAPLCSQMPQGPFACVVPGSVRRYSSPAASPSQWRPARAAGVHGAGGPGAGSSAAPAHTAAAQPQQTDMAAHQAAAEGGDGSDWEDAGRWLEPAAPGAAAALRTALAALAAGTPPKGTRSRRRNVSAPGSRHTSAPGSPTAASRRPNFTQPLPWTPAGVPGTDRRPWFEKVTESDGTPLLVSSRLPLPRRPLGVDPSLLQGKDDLQTEDEEAARAMASNLAGMLDAVSDEAVEPAAPADAGAAPSMQTLPLQTATPEQDAAVQTMADVHVAAHPTEINEQQGDAARSLLAVATGSAEQQAALPAAELPDASSDSDAGGSSPESGSPPDAAAPAGPAVRDATSTADAPGAVESEADAGPRRRRWRRVAPRRGAGTATPPGTAPPSPPQRSPLQHSPPQITGTTRAPGSPEPNLASATKRPRISPPPAAAPAVHAPPTPDPQPRTATFVLPCVPPSAGAAEATAALSSSADDADRPAELCSADASAERQTGAAAAAVGDAVADDEISAASAASSCTPAEEQPLPPGSHPADEDEDAAVSNFHEDDVHEEDLSHSSIEELASHSTVDSESGAEAATFQAAAAAAALAASPSRHPDRAAQRRAAPAAPPAAGPGAHSPAASSLSSVFEDAEAHAPLAGLTPFTPALAAAAAAADQRQHQGGKRLRFDDGAPRHGGVTSEIEPAEAPAGTAEGCTAVTAQPRGDTCSTHPIGSALLATQPGMRRASAGEVAAVLSSGVSMHKAWIHDTKRAATGSNRTICCRVAGGEVHVGYQRGLMRRSVSTTLYRVYMLDGNALAVDTAQGVLILRPPDAALHALVLLGMNAALALASGSAVASDALADVPWSHDIMLDDSVMQ